MASQQKKKPRELTIKEKVDLIKNSAGLTQRALAAKYGIGKTQVQSILKRKEKWLAIEDNPIEEDIIKMIKLAPAVRQEEVPTPQKTGTNEKRKPKELTIKEKVDLIKNSEGKSQRALAKKYDIGKTQVHAILKRKSVWLAAEENLREDRKRIKVGKQPDVDFLTYEWFVQAKAMNLPISGPLLQEKARVFAAQIGDDGFKASNGWLNRFKLRHNINRDGLGFKSRTGGNGSSVDPNLASYWQSRLPQIMWTYAARDIFNMDETVLFFRALPSKGGPSDIIKSDDRLTLSLCVNMEGEFEKTVVIGRKCLKNLDLNPLSLTWETNKKGLTNSEIFTRWIRSFNERMQSQNRRVVLLLDNATNHIKNLDLSNIELLYLPIDTTSKLLPLHQGIIKSVKMNYRKRLLQAILAKMVKGDQVTNYVSVLDALNWIHTAIREVSSSTISMCFHKVGLTNEWLIEPEEEISISGLVSKVQEHLGLTSDLMSADEYIKLDDEIETCDKELTELEKHILNEFIKNKNSTNTEDTSTVGSRKSKISSLKEAVQYVEELKLFLVENSHAGNLLNSAFELENGVCELYVKSTELSLNQTCVLDL